MKREYEEAFVEVDEIIKIMPIDLSSKIPVQFRKIISENKAKDYSIKIQEPLEQQKLNGKQLTEEEEKFLSIPRERKTTKETTPVTNEQKGKKKNDKKKKEEAKEENSKESVDPKYDINFSKKTDQVEQHSSMYIKNFLYYAYNNRLIKYDNKYQQEEKELNTEVLKTQKEEKIISLYEQSKCNTIENMDDTNYRNELLQNSKKFKENIISSRKKDTQKIESALKAREDLKKLMIDFMI